MHFYSPCQEMVQAAMELPEKQNVKLFFRHSKRFDNPVNGDYSMLLLTPEGIETAKEIGKGIDRPLGSCAASIIRRCSQTIEAVVSGMDKELCRDFSPDGITLSEKLCYVLGDPSPISSGGVGWYEYYHYLQTGNTEGSRGITLEMETKPILDEIFATGGKDGTLDLICSHDSHVVILASALFDLKTGMHGDNWCRFTEGLFFWGKRNDFYASWRGETRHFVNLYC
ncbi:MAG: histidine phosphatase family protein [Treponema sp.]|nr:histidine phosphatase family protein [Treponema sp.]